MQAIEQPHSLTRKLKIKRTGQHLQAVFSINVRQFARDQMDTVSECSVILILDTMRSKSFLVQSIPQDLMCIAGDAIHNLRSALDVRHE